MPRSNDAAPRRPEKRGYLQVSESRFGWESAALNGIGSWDLASLSNLDLVFELHELKIGDENIEAHRPAAGHRKVEILDVPGAVAGLHRNALDPFDAGAGIGQVERHLLGRE